MEEIISDIVTNLKNDFNQVFGADSEAEFFAPGRVNIIGEHTDYNGGHVLPCALDLGTYGLVRKRTDKKIQLFSKNFPDDGIVSVEVSELPTIYPEKRRRKSEETENNEDSQSTKIPMWSNYPLGVFMTFIKNGYNIPTGVDILLYGDIPTGAGLSSSASLNVLTGTIIKMIFGYTYISPIDIARYAQSAERQYCGTNCGIMDQFISAMGIHDHAIYLNTSNMKFRHIPMNLGEYTIILTDSKVKHQLVDSEYNERRSECNKALDEMQKIVDISNLCDLTPAHFTAFSTYLSSPLRKKRAYHAISENKRTIDAVEALEENDLHALGLLINESHISLRDYYEVSCDEIDFLVEEAWQTEGVLGSRMTGGGFGGCTLTLIESKCVDNFKEKIAKAYENKYNVTPAFYSVITADGAHRI